MKTVYTILTTALLASLTASAKELDQERLKRINRRFGELVKVEESLADGVPDLPPEPVEGEEERGWNLFGRADETLSRTTMAPQAQRRYIRRAPQKEKEDSGWGWLHAEVVAEQEKKAAERAELEEISRRSAEEAWRSSAMSEDDIQREVALRLKQEPSLLIPKEDADKLNPLKQLPQYKAMGKDYLSPAQRMLSPEYTRDRIARARLEKEEEKRSTLTQRRFTTPMFSDQQKQRDQTSTYEQTSSMLSELRKSSTLPRANNITQQQGHPNRQLTDAYSKPKRTIRDLRKLPSLDEQDPFEEQFPKVRRSIWDD